MMQKLGWMMVFAWALAAGCGDDSTSDDCGGDSAVTCPEGADDSGMGTGGATAADASMASGGSMGSGGAMETDASMASGGELGTGGAQGTGGMALSDASMGTGGEPATAGEMASDAATPEPPKEDGSALAACDNDRDCNQGLGCVSSSNEGRGFCSVQCSQDDQCGDLGAAGYCSGTFQLCAVQCDGPDDAASCLDGMTCLARTIGQGFHCQYPAPPVVLPTRWQACSGGQGGGCEGELLCAGSNGGYCTAGCVLDADCSDLPASGSVVPSCQSGGAGGDRCVLDCSADLDGCPTGMACVAVGGQGQDRMRCRFQ